MVALFWCLFLEFEAGRTKSSRKKAVEEKRFRHNLYSRHSPYRFEATNKNPNTGNDGRNTQERNSNEQLWNINEYSNRPTERTASKYSSQKITECGQIMNHTNATTTTIAQNKNIKIFMIIWTFIFSALCVLV